MPHLFGAKLRYLRNLKRLSQSELALGLGLASHTHINHIEAGRRAPSLDLVLRVAAKLGVSTDYLLCDPVPVETPLSVISSHGQDVPPQLFGTKLHYLRKQRSMTQTDLAYELGLASQGYISKLESGNKEPAPDLVVRIADTFGVTTDDLLRDDVLIVADDRLIVVQVKSNMPRGDAISDGEDGVPSER